MVETKGEVKRERGLSLVRVFYFFDILFLSQKMLYSFGRYLFGLIVYRLGRSLLKAQSRVRLPVRSQILSLLPLLFLADQ
jgi:hypothetical protein